MNHDELLHRLRRVDPAGDVPIEPVDGPRAAALLEHIMQTEPNEPTHNIDPSGTPPRRRRRLVAALGAVALAAAAGVAFVALRDDPAPSQLSLSLAASDPATSMCMSLNDITPTPGTIAFRGTVVDVSADSVTLDVASWYRGGGADRVVVSTAGMPSPALDGVTFEQGGDYLVTAADGQVGVCGMSGPWSAELEAIYRGWFPG
jgi:hypothetical protein